MKAAPRAGNGLGMESPGAQELCKWVALCTLPGFCCSPSFSPYDLGSLPRWSSSLTQSVLVGEQPDNPSLMGVT